LSEEEGQCLDLDVKLVEGQYNGLLVETCQFEDCQRTRRVHLPGHLAEGAAVAAWLSRLKEGGAAFDYPAALTPLEWSCLDALQRAIRADNQTARRIEQEKENFKQRSDALDASRRR
jgi:hypothetical protein